MHIPKGSNLVFVLELYLSNSDLNVSQDIQVMIKL